MSKPKSEKPADWRDISNAKTRLAAIVERHNLLEQIRRERGEKLKFSAGDDEGASTGLMVRELSYRRVEGGGYEGVEHYKVDTAMLAEFRALEEAVRVETDFANRRKESPAEDLLPEMSDAELLDALIDAKSKLPRIDAGGGKSRTH